MSERPPGAANVENGPDGTGETGRGESELSRRAVLKASGGVTGLFAVGTARGDGEPSADDVCAKSSTRPSMVHYDEDGMAACASDHEVTEELQAAVANSLEENFPTVGSLIDDGFVPYFDLVTADAETGVSHWLNPEYLGDDGVIDPERPESIMVDHEWWRPIGVMFVATRDGDSVDPPPAIYGEDDEACLPWHTHVGLPGRKSWWKYRVTHQDTVAALREGIPCRTPWMMHVWGYPHPESVYAHAAPPRGNRGGSPAEPAGFDTDAVPGEDELGPEVLPDVVRHRLGSLI